MAHGVKRTILRQAIALLENDDAWTDMFFAIDADEQDCHPASPEAKAWCAQGALHKSARELGFNDHQSGLLVADISTACTGAKGGLSDINELQGYDAVMAAMRQGLADLGGPVARPITASMVPDFAGEAARRPARAPRGVSARSKVHEMQG